MGTTRSTKTDVADLPPVPPKLEVALKVVARELTRDFRDTGDSVRDAMGRAPIAMVKRA